MLPLFSSIVRHTNTSSAQRRQIVDSLLRSGRMATITYVKKTTGETVSRNAKLWVERHLTSGDRRFVGVNPVANSNPDIYPYSDMEKNQFKSFSLNHLISVKIGGKLHVFS
jgi:hypothetical protein